MSHALSMLCMFAAKGCQHAALPARYAPKACFHPKCLVAAAFAVALRATAIDSRRRSVDTFGAGGPCFASLNTATSAPKTPQRVASFYFNCWRYWMQHPLLSRAKDWFEKTLLSGELARAGQGGVPCAQQACTAPMLRPFALCCRATCKLPRDTSAVIDARRS